MRYIRQLNLGKAVGADGLTTEHYVYQARIQILAKGEVVKIMENNVLLPQAVNDSDRMPRKRVPQPARMSFSGYTIDSE